PFATKTKLYQYRQVASAEIRGCRGENPAPWCENPFSHRLTLAARLATLYGRHGGRPLPSRLTLAACPAALYGRHGGRPLRPQPVALADCRIDMRQCRRPVRPRRAGLRPGRGGRPENP